MHQCRKNPRHHKCFTDENLANFPSLESEVSVPKLEDIIITASIVFDELNKLKTDKSPGPEGWPLRIFKECSEQLSIPLSTLLNKSFQSGVLPSEWRIGFVTPIHKKGSQHLTNNYRPVSLTSTVVKIMESIIKTNVLEHLISNNLLTSHQFGFLRGHSCTTQLLHVMDILTKSLDQGINLNESVLLRLYKSMVREYGNIIWGPHYILDQRKLEGVQRRATKLVPSLRDESYIN